MRALKSLLLVGSTLVLGLGCNFGTLDDQSKFTLIPGRTNTINSQYDRPVADVGAAVRAALNTLGTITEEKKLPMPEEEVVKTVFTARINTRHVRVLVKPFKESPDVISDVSVQVWTTSRNPDLLVAYETDKAIYNALVTASLQQTSN